MFWHLLCKFNFKPNYTQTYVVYYVGFNKTLKKLLMTDEIKNWSYCFFVDKIK